jgi:hypothetical protein
MKIDHGVIGFREETVRRRREGAFTAIVSSGVASAMLALIAESIEAVRFRRTSVMLHARVDARV